MTNPPTDDGDLVELARIALRFEERGDTAVKLMATGPGVDAFAAFFDAASPKAVLDLYAEIASLRQKLEEAEAAWEKSRDLVTEQYRDAANAMSELVERLNDAAHWCENGGGIFVDTQARLLREAAAALTLAQSQRDDAETIGIELERAIAQARLLPALKSWAPADCPTEIVGRLIHLVEDAQSQRDALAKAAEPFKRALRWEETEGAFASVADPELPAMRYHDALPLHCVAWPGEDQELVSEDVMFTLGDIRALAAAADMSGKDVQAMGEE